MRGSEKFLVGNREFRMRVEMPNNSSRLVVACHGHGSNSNDRKIIELKQKLLQNDIGIARTTFPSDYVDRDDTLMGWTDALRAELNTLNQYNINSIGLFGSSLGGVATLYVAPTDSRIKAVVTIATGYENVYESPLSIRRLKELNNILIIHGKKDEIVDYRKAERLYRIVNEPKELFLVPDADHRFSDYSKRLLAIEKAVGWFNQYLI